jgi:hypothetical protein
MQDLTTTANLVEYETLEAGGSITAVLERSDLEAALDAEGFQLWFELGRAEDEESRRVTIDLASADIEAMLRLATGDEVVLALDGDTTAGLLDDPDVEAHGLRGALAIAVATAAIVAPAGLAATPQAASPATTPQVTSQVSTAAATSQVSSQVSSQVTTQVSRAAATAQVKGLVAKTQVQKTQVHRSLVVKAAGVTILRGGLAQ